MEKPLLSLTTKDFQSGISMMGAHAERGGLFYKADGVTPVFGAGSSQNVNNGLLMAGAGSTAIGYGSAVGNIMSLIPDAEIYFTGGAGFIGTTSSHELIAVQITDTAAPTFGAISVKRTISGQTLTPGIVVYRDSGNNRYLFYRQVGQIGRFDPTGPTYADDWNTAANDDYFGAMYVHYLLNKVIFGNGPGKVGTIDSSLTVTQSALTFDSQSSVTDISDDGEWVVLAITRNTAADANLFSDSQVLYWDGSKTTGFLKAHTITDPFIYALKKTPIGLFAYGLTGIWQVTIEGVKRVFNHNPGVYTASGVSSVHYGRGAASYFSDALLWGGQSGSGTVRTLKSLGKLDSAALSAYLHPVLLTANVNITAVNAQILKGYVMVADSTPAIKAYPIGSGTPQTGVSAQTRYFDVSQPVSITHIDVIFGEPLASGDTLDLDVFRDEDNSAVDFGAVSYSATKTTRRYQFKNANAGHLEVDQQLALKLTFTAGAVKIKRVDVFGIPRERTNP